MSSTHLTSTIIVEVLLGGIVGGVLVAVRAYIFTHLEIRRVLVLNWIMDGILLSTIFLIAYLAQ